MPKVLLTLFVFLYTREAFYKAPFEVSTFSSASKPHS
jgi:hypothetical protein